MTGTDENPMLIQCTLPRGEGQLKDDDLDDFIRVSIHVPARGTTKKILK